MNIKKLDKNIEKQAWDRMNSLVKPVGSLGRLEDLAVKLCKIYGRIDPKISKKTVVVMCADHGVTCEQVASAPKEVTHIQAVNIARQKSGAGALAAAVGADLHVYDIGIDLEGTPPQLIDRKIRRGTGNIKTDIAMTVEEAKTAVETGIAAATQAAGEGAIIAIGEMGIGNTTPTTAIISLLSGKPASEITGLGANLDPSKLPHKAAVIEQALALHRDKISGLDPYQILSCIGGLEIAGMAGTILGAAKASVPVIIDGYIATAAALIAQLIDKSCREYMIPSHASHEKGARTASDLLGLKPYFDLEMRLGEGSGAVLVFGLCEAACTIMNDMATFEQTGIDVV